METIQNIRVLIEIALPLHYIFSVFHDELKLVLIVTKFINHEHLRNYNFRNQTRS